jgi:hypothetical protein
MTDPLESAAQAVAERVIDLVAHTLDVNTLLARVDVDELLGRVDLNQLLDRVDVDRLLDRVDVDRLLDRVDVAAVVGRADINSVAARIDIDALVEQTDIGAVIARSSGSVASGTVDVMRSQAFNFDELIARCAARLLRRRYQGPPGPPKMSRVATKP